MANVSMDKNVAQAGSNARSQPQTGRQFRIPSHSDWSSEVAYEVPLSFPRPSAPTSPKPLIKQKVEKLTQGD
jgi:hypothetical protein